MKTDAARTAEGRARPAHVEVAAGIVWRAGRCLAACRPEGGVLGGCWEFPGGKLEPGESPLDALKRELAEELGIGVRAARFWQSLEHWYPETGLTVRLHFFHVTDFAGEPCAAEGQVLRWVRPEEAAHLDFLAADREVVAQLREAGAALV